MKHIEIFPGALKQFLRIMGTRGNVTYLTIARMAFRQFGPAAPSVAEIAAAIGTEFRGQFRLNRLRRDSEVADWLLANAAGRMIDELHSAVIMKFGAARTPSRSAIHRFLVKHAGPAVTRRKSWADRDTEVAAWVREYRPEHTLDTLRAACIDRFGAPRTPSRSALHRFLRR